jgi:hypothetical protein
MDRTLAQPQVNLSLLRSNSLKFQPKGSQGTDQRLYITIVRGIDYIHYTSRLCRADGSWKAGGGGIWCELVTVYVCGYRKFQIYSQESTKKIYPVHVMRWL